MDQQLAVTEFEVKGSTAIKIVRSTETVVNAETNLLSLANVVLLPRSYLSSNLRAS